MFLPLGTLIHPDKGVMEAVCVKFSAELVRVLAGGLLIA